jgi:xylulose-5-phosphate/fructose-6-phosphate phosphoketolase
MHATGAVMDNPGLIAACVVGDGEAETGPLAASWTAPFFLNPVRDGAVLPILHLNGAKISGPTVLGRRTDEDVEALLRANGWEPVTVSGDQPGKVHRALAAALDNAYATIRDIQRDARDAGPGDTGTGRNRTTAARWPAIILRTPKGWTGPESVDGSPVEGTFRAHQVPLSGVKDDPEHLALLEQWMRSYQPESLFDDGGRLLPELAALAPEGRLRMGAAPWANGQPSVPLEIPDLAQYAVDPGQPGSTSIETTKPLGELFRDLYTGTEDNPRFRLFCPDETNSNRLGAVFEATDRCLMLPGETTGMTTSRRTAA